MRNLILTSFTPTDAPGGVPRWNRDIKRFFPEAKHYSWTDVVKDMGRDVNLPEWDRARALNAWLKGKGLVKPDDIILTDGFWGLGLEGFPNVVSVAHGNWSHTTKDDVEKGIPPEFPLHHAVQVDYRRRHLSQGGRIVAVSDFIAHQCDIQWGFKMPVINNGIDTGVFVPAERKLPRKRPLVIHGTTTTNKGFDHIEILESSLDADVLLLDRAAKKLGLPKYEALAQADIVVHPSAHEGNSYFVAESLSCGIPIVSYDVGLMFETRLHDEDRKVGVIMDRRERNPQKTVEGVRQALERLREKDPILDPRGYISNFSIERFGTEWRSYLEREFGYSI